MGLSFLVDMEKEIFLQTPKLSLELKQTSKGILYIGSLKINVDNLDELDNLIDKALPRINLHIINSNNNTTMANNNDSNIKEDLILTPDEKILFEQLRKLRLDIAQKEKLPPFIIFHDIILKQFAKLKPKTREEMLNIKGIGEIKFQKYGVFFIDFIAKFVGKSH